MEKSQNQEAVYINKNSSSPRFQSLSSIQRQATSTTPQLSPTIQRQHRLQIKQFKNLIIGENLPTTTTKSFSFSTYRSSDYLHTNPWKKYFEDDINAAIQIPSLLLFKTVPQLNNEQSVSRKYNLINSNNIGSYGDELALTTFVDDEAVIYETNDVYKTNSEYDLLIKQLRDSKAPILVEELVQTNGVLKEWIYYDFKYSSIHRYDLFIKAQVGKCWSCFELASNTNPKFYEDPIHINQYREVCFNIQHFKAILESHLFPGIYGLRQRNNQNVHSNYSDEIQNPNQQGEGEDCGGDGQRQGGCYYQSEKEEKINIDSEYQMQQQLDAILIPKLRFSTVMDNILLGFIQVKQINLGAILKYWEDFQTCLDNPFYKFYIAS